MQWYETLKALREDSGESMSKAAESIGIPKGTYASYEYGKREPNIEMISKIAEHFGVTTDYLLGRPDAKEPPDPIASLPTVDEMEKDLFREWLDLDEASRKAFLDVLRKIVADDQKRQAEAPPVDTLRK